MKYITAADLKNKLDNHEKLQIVDTRESGKFDKAHLPKAINIPQIDLPEKIDLLSREIPVIIYCQYGVKSQAPYLYLVERLKFKNILILEGGIFQWTVDVDPEMNAD